MMQLTLRHKVLGSLLVVLGLFILLASYALYHVQRPFFEEIEHNEVSDQLNRTFHLIDDDRKMLEAFLLDWATWDDTWQFAKDRNQQYQQSNLATDYFGNRGFSFVIFVNNRREFVWAEAYDSNGQGGPIGRVFPDPPDADNPLLSPGIFNEIASGFTDTPAGPALVSSAPILQSSGQGPASGHLIAGILFDSHKLAQMNLQLSAEVKLVPFRDDSLALGDGASAETQDLLDETMHVVAGDENIHALAVIRDLSSRPLSVLNVSRPRDVIALGNRAFQGSLILLVCAALVVLATLWFLLRGMVLSRVEQLTRIMVESREEQSVSDFGTILDETIQALKHWRDNMSPAARKDEIGQLVHAFENLSTALQKTTLDIWKIAHLDGLTSLPNRRLYFERLYQQVEQARMADSKLAVLFLDLDDFKEVNDGLGHNAGDEVLKQVANRLKPLLNLPKRMNCDADVTEATELHQDMVARIGGDEFVVMLLGDSLDSRVEETAASIVNEISKPFHVKADSVTIGASVGIAIFPRDGDSVDNLVQHADVAMYAAKQCGKNAWQRYDAESKELRNMPGTGTFRKRRK
jgi:GGDEF domain-containing protein/sensor domain CHASE-containing protein